jgi:hypothetical protein
MSVSTYITADPGCFGSRDVKILGWLDQGPFCEGMPPGINPEWLWACAKAGLWQEPSPVYAGSAYICNLGDCQSLPIAMNPASTVNLGLSMRWVVLTLHRDDPAAETCHWVYPPNWTGEHPSDVYARQTCREAFVVTGMSPALAPTSP